MPPTDHSDPGDGPARDDYDEVWQATLAGEFDPEPDLGYHPGED